MPIPLGLPGLENVVPEIPDGRILVVEGGTDPTKSFFARHIARQAAVEDRLVTLVTSRGAEEIVAHYERHDGAPEALRVHEAAAWDDMEAGLGETSDLVVDSFSFLALSATRQELTQGLRAMRARCRATGDVAVLSMERGMLDAAAEAVVHHLADGILQFHVREDTEGIVQYVRIPRWMDGGVHTRNIYYSFDGRRILVDTRNRVN